MMKVMAPMSSSIVRFTPEADPGNSAADKEWIFEIFYAAKVPGTGLDFSICRSVISAHGGQLCVSAGSPRAQYSRFTCRMATAPKRSLRPRPLALGKPHCYFDRLDQSVRVHGLAQIFGSSAFRQAHGIRQRHAP